MKRKAVIAVLGVLALTYILLVGSFLVWTRTGDGPVIGMSVSREWYDRMQFHRAPYDLAVKRAGGVVLTIEPQNLEDLEQILKRVDGLVLAGGGDVDPSLFGGDPEKAEYVNRARDDFELALLKRAEELEIPVLGICRGIQILAVSEGGKLQNLRENEALADRHGISVNSLQAHEVWLREGTKLHALLGPGPLKVNSFHFQSVADPGRLMVSATDRDGVIEAVEKTGDRLVMGIQWHPELIQQEPFQMLISAARAFKTRR